MADDRIPAVIAGWQRDVMARHAAKTQENEHSRLKVIAEAFQEFRAGQVQAPDAALFLRQFQHQARTHNQYRQLLRELMRYSIELGFRLDNPISHLRTMREAPRTRYITDSEIRRIKVGCIYGDDGKRTRSGLMIAALIDMAYLTGQDIGMLLNLRWSRDADDPNAPYVSEEGMFFRRAKVLNSTGAAVTIQWTPRLLEVVERLKRLRAERMLKERADKRVVSEYLFTTQAGHQFTYSGAGTAWKRGVKRAGVKGAMFRDIRAKALTDIERGRGMAAARDMGQHSTDSQTADYVRLRSGRSTKATK